MIKFFLLSVLQVVAISHRQPAWAQNGQPGRSGADQIHYESPRLESLARELDEGNSGTLDQFWRFAPDHAPLIEPASDDARYYWITFIWRGSAQTRKVDLLGDVANPDSRKRGMGRFRETGLWFKTERVPRDARFAYAIRENDGRFDPDPLNTRHLAGRCLVELPDAPTQP